MDEWKNQNDDRQSDEHQTEKTTGSSSGKNYTNDSFLEKNEVYNKYKKGRLQKKIIAVILLLAVGAAAYFFIFNKQSQTTNSGQSSQIISEEPPKTFITEETERHSSTQFYLSFDHPTDWVIEDRAGSGLLTATSPVMDIPVGQEQTVSGQVRLQIRSKTKELTEFKPGNSLAVQDSKKITYTKPSSAQRGQTFISFLSWANSTSSNSIDGVYITGDFGYQKEQAIPEVDIEKIDPRISIVFFACDGTCDQPLAIAPTGWQVTEFGDRLEKILTSFTIN
jgi:hypothetical protein